ncbi:MAG: nicotinate (nicotinamide) nucleotide adenylyltransferase [Lachnospiraceae bacterium]|nr:nicotinate (nicotinamide) nucleotide adenylyltransferase [Lachnospiraceae bacterium]
MLRIGILGGTFDPIHIGHMEMARAAVSELTRMGEALDKLLIIPAGHPYFKGDITPYEMRCEMVKIAVDELNAEISRNELVPEDFRYELSYLEKDEGKPTYTFETLQKIHEEEPGSKLYFICGEDVYDSLHMWRSPEIVLDEAALVVFERKDDDYERAKQSVQKPQMNDGSDIGSEQRIKKLQQINSHARIIPIKHDIPAVSSTQIRKAVSGSEAIDSLVSQGIAKYIQENSLYRS